MALTRRNIQAALDEPPYEMEDVPRCQRNLEGSCIVRVTERQLWLKMLGELLQVCNEAALRFEARCKAEIDKIKDEHDKLRREQILQQIQSQIQIDSQSQSHQSQQQQHHKTPKKKVHVSQQTAGTSATYSASGTKAGHGAQSIAASTSTGGSSIPDVPLEPLKIPYSLVPIHTGKPLSIEYMADRLDLDDPLIGYTVRTLKEGWMQGFITISTFTSWQRWFRWDSLSDEAGMLMFDTSGTGMDALHSMGVQNLDPDNPATEWWMDRNVDGTGELAAALNAEIRDGDPDGEGVIWPHVAELSLLGGLGCGGALVKLIIDELESENSPYNYCVLQATENSIPFYESQGFIRVGAIARYFQKPEQRSSKTAAQIPVAIPMRSPTRTVEHHARPQVPRFPGGGLEPSADTEKDPNKSVDVKFDEDDGIDNNRIEAQHSYQGQQEAGLPVHTLQPRSKRDTRSKNQSIVTEKEVEEASTGKRRILPRRVSLSRAAATPPPVEAKEDSTDIRGTDHLRDQKQPESSFPQAPELRGASSRFLWHRVKSSSTPTCRDLARKYGIQASDLVFMNRRLYQGLKESSKLVDGTMMRVPQFPKFVNALNHSPPQVKPAKSHETVRLVTNDTKLGCESSNGLWYQAVDNESPRTIANRLGLDVRKLIQMNASTFPDLNITAPLMQGTILRLPRRAKPLRPVDPEIEEFEQDWGFGHDDANLENLTEVMTYRHWSFSDDPVDMSVASYMMVRPLVKRKSGAPLTPIAELAQKRSGGINTVPSQWAYGSLEHESPSAEDDFTGTENPGAPEPKYTNTGSVQFRAPTLQSSSSFKYDQTSTTSALLGSTGNSMLRTQANDSIAVKLKSEDNNAREGSSQTKLHAVATPGKHSDGGAIMKTEPASSGASISAGDSSLTKSNLQSVSRVASQSCVTTASRAAEPNSIKTSVLNGPDVVNMSKDVNVKETHGGAKRLKVEPASGNLKIISDSEPMDKDEEEGEGEEMEQEEEQEPVSGWGIDTRVKVRIFCESLMTSTVEDSNGGPFYARRPGFPETPLSTPAGDQGSLEKESSAKAVTKEKMNGSEPAAPEATEEKEDDVKTASSIATNETQTPSKNKMSTSRNGESGENETEEFTAPTPKRTSARQSARKKQSVGSHSSAVIEDAIVMRTRSGPKMKLFSGGETKARVFLVGSPYIGRPCWAQLSRPLRAPIPELKTPIRPRRPLTAYMHYNALARDDMKNKHPDADFQGLARIMGEAWRNMTDSEREIYNRRAEVDKRKYDQAMLVYERELRKYQEAKGLTKPNSTPTNSGDNSNSNSSSTSGVIAASNALRSSVAVALNPLIPAKQQRLLVNQVVRLEPKSGAVAREHFLNNLDDEKEHTAVAEHCKTHRRLSQPDKFYFVLTYIPDLFWARLAPMQQSGFFTDPDYKYAKHRGRPKWVLVPEEQAQEIDVSAQRCVLVKSCAVKRTADADNEEWDLFTDVEVKVGEEMRKNKRKKK